MEQLVRVQPINDLIKIQVVLLVVTSLIILCYQEIGSVISYLYGGIMGVANTFIQRWHLIGSAKHARSDATMNLRKAYRCVLERWVLTVSMFAIGFGVLTLSFSYLMAGFIMTQLALLFGNLNRAKT